MHITEVIKRPILSEKTYKQSSTNRTYTFEVNRKANKNQIKQAFETIFEVKVDKINIINQDPKDKKVGRFTGKTNHVKKAIIKLKEGQSLEMFGE